MPNQMHELDTQWELGSEFHWSDTFLAKSTQDNTWPSHFELFSTACSALISLRYSLCSRSEIPKIHLPTFFCMNVVSRLQPHFQICWYRDRPIEPAPDFSSLQPQAGEFVLAVNLFGLRSQPIWQEWAVQHPDVILIEDHTHDPCSAWARQSIAPYAIASFRKTLPLPDGAIIWSPIQRPLPSPRSTAPVGGWQKLTAMLLKQGYLQSYDLPKTAYRSLEVEGETNLHTQVDSAPSAFTAATFQYLDIKHFRQTRSDNIRHALKTLNSGELRGLNPLFQSWPEGNVPFNLILLLDTPERREALRQFLIQQQVYPAIHWRQDPKTLASNDPVAIELSNRILTIPLDHRYTIADVDRVMTLMTHTNFLNICTK
jgi:hypothetical protein